MTRSAGRIVLALAGFVLLASAAGAREKKKEVVYNEQGEIVKTGMNFGPLRLPILPKSIHFIII